MRERKGESLWVYHERGVGTDADSAASKLTSERASIEQHRNLKSGSLHFSLSLSQGDQTAWTKSRPDFHRSDDSFCAARLGLQGRHVCTYLLASRGKTLLD